MSGSNRPAASVFKEVLLRLAAGKLTPTPANFTKAYEEVTGERESGLLLLQDLRDLVAKGGVGISPSGLASLGAELTQATAPQLAELLLRLVKNGEQARAILEASAPVALTPFLAARPDLQEELALLISHGGPQALRATDEAQLDAWRRFAKKCNNLAGAERELGQSLRRLLYSVAAGLGALADEGDATAGQVETLARIAKNDALTVFVVKEAEKALLDLAQAQDRSRHELRERKGELQHIVLDVIRRFATEAADLGVRSERVADLSQRVLDSEDTDLMRETLLLLVEEAGALGHKMKDAQSMLDTREAEIAKAQHEISTLRAELVEVSQKVKEDSLTGALNRRGLEEAALREVSLAERGSQTLSLAILDIDDFKAFNDTLGHDGGDQALKYLAKTLVDILRPSDSICRFGGEEFVILLPHSAMADAKKIIQRAQRALTKDIWLHKHQRLLTFSSGVTSWRPADDLAKMIARADHLMYCAKNKGKNRVYGDGDDAEA